MQAGFCLLENGSVQRKSSSSILIKNLFDVCFGALSFWLFGFGFAFGLKEGDWFIGSDPKYFASKAFDCVEKDLYVKFIFQFSFSATSSTIVSGSLAERTRLPAYIAFSVLMSGFINPVVMCWVWG
jgi:Amt family ammonium transporter